MWYAQTAPLTRGFFLALRPEDLRRPLTVMAGAAGVAVSATGVEVSSSLLASPLSLADAMVSSD
jgi:hypothetical protein